MLRIPISSRGLLLIEQNTYYNVIRASTIRTTFFG
jgi:hypothetical protein